MNNYPWAANTTKLAQARMAVTEAKKLDPKVEINEATIKAEYIKRAGLVIGVKEVAVEAQKPAPKTK